VYNTCQVKTLFNLQAPAVGESQSESGVILHFQRQKSYVPISAPVQVTVSNFIGSQTPVVTDEGDYTRSNNTLSASWTYNGTVEEYQYSIYSVDRYINPITGDEFITTEIIKDWTSVGTVTFVTATGLGLQDGETYYFGVKARNGTVWSEPGNSNGIAIDSVAPSVTDRTLNPQRVGESLVFQVSANDTVSGIADVDLVTIESSHGGSMRSYYEMTYNSATQLYETNFGPSTKPGVITYCIEAVDIAGNIADSSTRDLIIDLPSQLQVTPATLNFSATQGGTNPDNQTLTITNTGGGALNWQAIPAVTWLRLNPSSGTTLSGGSTLVTVSTDISGLNEGTYNSNINISSDGGNQSITVNLTVISVSPPVAPANLTARPISESQINLTWQDNSNNEIGVKIERKTGASGTWGQIAFGPVPNINNYNDTGLVAGTTYYYRVRYYNAVGDSDYSNEASAITQDNTPPIRPIVTDRGTYTNSTTALTASWSSYDPESEVKEYQYSITQDTPEGAVICDWISVGLDTLVEAQGLNLVGGRTYYFRVKARNSAGLWSEIGYSDGIIVDSVSPVGVIKINNDETYTNTTLVTVTLSATDAISGVSQMQFSNIGTAAWSEPEPYTVTKSWTLDGGDGLKSVYVRFKDSAGNWSAPYSDTITLDTVSPKASITNPASGATVSGSVLVTVNTSDNIGVAKVEFCLDTSSNKMGSDDTAPYEFLWDTVNVTNGDHALVVIAYDLAGNQKWQGQLITVSNIPPSAPAMLLAIPVSSTQINLGWVDKANNETGFKIERKIGAEGMWGTIADIPLVNVVSYNDTGLAVGTTYYYRVKAYNNIGDSGYSNIASATLDGIPPTGSIRINNGDEYTVDRIVSLTLEAVDTESGVTQMQFSNDGINWSEPEAYAGEKSWGLPCPPDGPKTVYVKFKDAAGNWSDPVSDTIILDTSKPTTPIVTDDGVYTNSTTTLSASWSSSDPESGIAEYQYRIASDAQNTKVVRDWTSTGTDTLVVATGLRLSNGKRYYFFVKARNGAGLWSEVGRSDGITVDITLPLVVNLTRNLQPRNKPVLFRAKVIDTISGVNSVSITIDNITKIYMNYNPKTRLYEATFNPRDTKKKLLKYYLTAQDNAGNKVTKGAYYLVVR